MEFHRRSLHKRFTLHIIAPREHQQRDVSDVVCHGPLKNKTIVEEILPQMDVLFFPSLKDCSSIPVVEAAMAGVPAVASSSGGIPSLIEHGKTGYLVKDPASDELIERLMFLADHPETLHTLGLQAREKAIREFNPTLLYRKMLDVVGTVIHHR